MENIYLSVKEVAEMLRRSENAVRHLARRRQIPHKYVGGRRLLFIKEDLEKWVNDCDGLTYDEWHKGQSQR